MAIPTIFDALAKAVADANAKAKATTTAPVTTPAKTTTTAPKTSTPSLIQDIKTSQATGKSLLQVIKERQATPTKTETVTTTATKTTTPPKFVASPLNPLEQLIGKTNPAMAQKMYESRTGKTVTAPITEPSSGRIGLTDTATPTTGTKVVTPPVVTPGIQSNLFYNPLESFIAKTNPQMARNMFESRVEKNKFNETVVTNQAQSDIKGSIAYKFNVPVNDYDYTTESNRLSSDITSAEANIQSNWTWLKNYNSYERGINNNISTIQSGPSDAKWEIDINQDNKIDPDTEVFTPSQAIDYFKGELSSAKLTKQNVEANITLLDSDIKSMKKSKIYLEEYQRKGYYLDVKDGEYYFSEPKASEVVEKVYGDRPDLYIASELRTLGFGVLLAGGQDLLSGGGTKSLEANREATAESILGATRLEGESIESHAVRFWTSGEAIMDVWVPVATLGLSKALTVGGRLVAPKLISWGSKLLSEAGPTTKTIVAGAKTVGAVGSKILSEPVAQYGMKYGMYGMMEAPNLISIAQERPEMFGSTLGKSLYRWEVTWGAMDVGFDGGIRAKAKGPWIEEDIKSTLNIPSTVQEQKAVGLINVIQEPSTKQGEMQFIAGGRVAVKPVRGGEPVMVDVEAYGLSNEIEAIKGIRSSESSGIARYTWDETVGLRKKTQSIVKPFEGSAFEVGKVQETRIISSVEIGMGELEPTMGGSLTKVASIGETTKGTTVEFYASTGKYSNVIEDMMGDQTSMGFVFTKQGKKEVAGIEKGGVNLIERPGKSFKKTPWSFEKNAGQDIASQPLIEKTATPTTDIGSKLTSEASKIVSDETGIVATSGAGLMSGAKVSLRELEAMEFGIQPSSKWDATKPSGATSTRRISRSIQGIDNTSLLSVSSMSLEGAGEININENDIFTGNIYGTDLGINLGIKEDNIPETGTRLSEEVKIDTSQASKSESISLSKSESLTEMDLISPTEYFPNPIKPTIFIPKPRFPRRPKQEDEEEKYFKPVKRQRELIKSTSRRRAKGLMADLLSVTQSQARYGKSTQPKLTTKLWKESEKSLFKRVPTQELMKGGRTKADNLIGNKKKGGKKNVYY